jgi:SanA protein
MLFRLLLFLLVVGSLALILPRLLTSLYALQRIYRVENVPVSRVAVVFGAGLYRDGRPTPVLRDRVHTAAQLFFNGKVEKLLMTGDNSFLYYNEPQAMQEYALELGVPEKAIVLDYAGRRTYDSCYRAREIFGVRDAILVTQNFHMSRALYICNNLDVSAVGVPADLHEYRQRSLFYWNLRELPATLNALLEIHVTHPLPVLGNPEPIFPAEAQ